MIKTTKIYVPVSGVFLLPALYTAAIGYNFHGSLFWSFVDFFLWPFAWIKWLLFN